MSDNKTKCMWSICNEILGKNISRDDSKISGEPTKIANQFNEYLLNIVPELLENLEKKHFFCNISVNSQSMFLRPVTTHEICNLAGQIKNKHSSGIDEIPTSLVKITIPYISNVLCFLINNSFKNGIFPNQLKTAVIKTLYKKGNPETISLTPCILKTKLQNIQIYMNFSAYF